MAVETIECPVCFESCEEERRNAATLEETIHGLRCARCGWFDVTHGFYNLSKNPKFFLGEKGSRERANLSAWIREYWDEENKHREKENRSSWNPLVFKPEFLQEGKEDELKTVYLSSPKPQYFHQRADKLMLALEKETKHAGDFLDCSINVPSWIARAWALNEEELDAFFYFLKVEDRISGIGLDYLDGKIVLKQDIMILPTGWAHLEQLHQKREQSKQGFVAMDFCDELKPFYDRVLAPAIKAAGYAPLRVDRKEHGNRIDDEIEVQIKNSRFVVADFTFDNKNVYFETGFALGQGIPVIWTCNRDHAKELKFDIQRFNQLRWDGTPQDPENIDEFIKSLAFRIENICGPGPEKPKES